MEPRRIRIRSIAAMAAAACVWGFAGVDAGHAQEVEERAGERIRVPTRKPVRAAQAVRERPSMGKRPPATPGVPGPAEARHRIEVDGLNLPGNTRLASRLAGRIDVVPYRNPGESRMRLRPGNAQFEAIVFSGPLPLPAAAKHWFEGFQKGQQDRRSGSVILLDAALQEQQRHNFYEAIPTGLEVDVSASAWYLTVAVERIEFVVK